MNITITGTAWDLSYPDKIEECGEIAEGRCIKAVTNKRLVEAEEINVIIDYLNDLIDLGVERI